MQCLRNFVIATEVEELEVCISNLRRLLAIETPKKQAHGMEISAERHVIEASFDGWNPCGRISTPTLLNP